MIRESSMRPHLWRAGVLVAAIALSAAAHRHLDTASPASRGDHFIPRPSHARFAAMGFNALVSDYYWLQAVQVLGGTTQNVGGREALLERLVDVVTTVNPWVDHPYRFAALWFVRDEAMVRRTNQLLRRGIAYHPRDWRNRYYLGFNHFFYLDEDEEAADVLETAIDMPGAPDYLGALVARLRSGRGGLEAAEALLARMARETEDGYARAEYLKALDSIETERRARFLDRARKEFRRRNGRDIRSVDELARGPHAVVRSLPPAHPHFDDFHWEIDAKSGQIVSSFYGSRYELHVHPQDRARQERWREKRKGEGEV